jgi:hypothetical protein
MASLAEVFYLRHQSNKQRRRSSRRVARLMFVGPLSLDPLHALKILMPQAVGLRRYSTHRRRRSARRCSSLAIREGYDLAEFHPVPTSGPESLLANTATFDGVGGNGLGPDEGFGVFHCRPSCRHRWACEAGRRSWRVPCRDFLRRIANQISTRLTHEAPPARKAYAGRWKRSAKKTASRALDIELNMGKISHDVSFGRSKAKTLLYL